MYMYMKVSNVVLNAREVRLTYINVTLQLRRTLYAGTLSLMAAATEWSDYGSEPLPEEPP